MLYKEDYNFILMENPTGPHFLEVRHKSKQAFKAKTQVDGEDIFCDFGHKAFVYLMHSTAQYEREAEKHFKYK